MRQKLFVVALIIFAGCFGFILGQSQENIAGAPGDRFQLIHRVYEHIQQYYVEDVEADKLIDGAIRGMIDSLDKYSSYLSQERYEEMQMEMKGEYGGVGIVITIRDNKTTVVSTFKGTPSYDADVKPGDIIRKVDGTETEGYALDAVADMIRGAEGTRVVLTMYRPDEDREFEVELVRAIVEIPYVEYQLRDDKIGVVTITQFAEDVGSKTYNAMRTLERQGAEGIILDLRFNPGGLLREAVNVSSVFIPRGPVVHVADRSGVVETLNTNVRYQQVKLPLVVLVNEGTASGSEIVAAAIQEHETGILMGSTTFGKGTVQTIIPLVDGSALRLTTAKYYTSMENSIHEEGVLPDIQVEQDYETEEDEQLDAAIKYLLDRALPDAS